jgi:hypothetical protein
MKIKSPILTLLVGLLIAIVIAILSVHASQPGKTYGESVVLR